MSATGGTDADRAARDRLAREARETATTLLDWVGTRVEAVRADTGEGPRQGPGPCTWCPVCALVAALRGEQSELGATLAEQASGLLVLLRLLVAAHADGSHDHHAAPPPATESPEAAGPAGTAEAPDGRVASTPPGWPAEWGVPTGQTDVPWEVAPHATFDPAPAARATPDEPVADDDARTSADRPTGRRGPRPSPRRPAMEPAGAAPGPATEPTPRPAVATAPAPDPPIPAGPGVRAATPGRRGVQRIPVRRRPRPC